MAVTLTTDTAAEVHDVEQQMMARGSSAGDDLEPAVDVAPEKQPRALPDDDWQNPSGTYRGQASMRSLCPAGSEFLGRYCIADGQSRLFKDLCFQLRFRKPHPSRPPHAVRLLTRGIGSSSARVSDAIDINPDAPVDKGKSPANEEEQEEDELPELLYPTVYGACPDYHLCLQDQNPEGTRASINCVSLHAIRLDNLKNNVQYGYRVIGRPETDDELAQRGVVINVLRNLGAGTVSAALCTHLFYTQSTTLT